VAKRAHSVAIIRVGQSSMVVPKMVVGGDFFCVLSTDSEEAFGADLIVSLKVGGRFEEICPIYIRARN
jgi:hypothetical protein